MPCASVSAKRTLTSVENEELVHRGKPKIDGCRRRPSALLRERQPCVVLTGAGISTRGIPDFRSPTGIWAEVDPLEVASIRAFQTRSRAVWSFYRTRIHSLLAAEPNTGHVALAELERRGLVDAVVTQNIDTLHRRAGSRRWSRCTGRSARRLSELPSGPRNPSDLEQLEEHRAPRCVHCGEILKPGVTLFGELLPVGAVERATDLARSAALMVVVGSTLEVWPVAGLPLAARSLAIVNRGATALDDRAILKIDAGAGETLAEVVAVLG